MHRTSRSHRASAVIVAAGIIGAIIVLPSPAAAADQFDDLRNRWRAVLSGEGVDPTSTRAAAAIDSLDATAQANWSSIDPTPTSDLWADLDTAASRPDVLESLRRLKSMALAYATVGSDLEGDIALLADTVAGLDWLTAARYNTTTPTDTAMWWQDQLGIPLELNDLTVLLYDDLTTSQVSSYMGAIERFRPTPTGTGANRVWSTMVVGLRGVIVKSASKVAAARDGVAPALDYVTSGDGFHPDGSFIQHGDLAYTGGYGVSLLSNIANLVYLLHGSAWEISDPRITHVVRWVDEGFDPFIVRGVMMDAVRGREVSRDFFSDRDAGGVAIRAVLVLAETVTGADRARLRSAVKGWLTDDPDLYYSGASVFAVGLGEGLSADTSVVAQEPLLGTFTFNSMERVVHRTEGFVAGISMSSKRVGNYESINGENLKGWFQGDGMTTLYVNGLSPYSGDHWATVNPFRLPGTTVDTKNRAPGSSSSYNSPHLFSGGVTSPSGAYGVAGMSLNADGSELVAQKSWFLLDDEIVALGSAISATGQSGTGWDGQPRRSVTTIDTRPLGSSGSSLLVDGVAAAPTSGPTVTKADPSWAHLTEGAGGAQIGYVFPDTADLKLAKDTRTRSWSESNTFRGSTDARTDTYYSLWFDHGQNPSGAGYSYVVLPAASAAETAAYAASPDVEVLAHTDRVSAVSDAGIGVVAANFWTNIPSSVPLAGSSFLTASAKSSVVSEETATGIAVSVSDPTQSGSAPLTIEIARSASSVLSTSPGVTVTQLSPSIRFTVDVVGARGAAFEADFAY